MTNQRPILQVIIGSTRPTRVGDAVAKWFFSLADDHGEFDVELVDLAEVNLPLLDEPEQASTGDYRHAHTKAWAATVARADAFVFVIPEYNHGVNAATKNAVDFLYAEWLRKPFGVVSYGGVSRGLRAATSLKTSLTSLKMTWSGDVSVALAITPVTEGVFEGDAALARSARLLLDELAVLAPLLRQTRD